MGKPKLKSMIMKNLVLKSLFVFAFSFLGINAVAAQEVTPEVAGKVEEVKKVCTKGAEKKACCKKDSTKTAACTKSQDKPSCSKSAEKKVCTKGAEAKTCTKGAEKKSCSKSEGVVNAAAEGKPSCVKPCCAKKE